MNIRTRDVIAVERNVSVPPAIVTERVAQLASILRGARVAVLTGAGCSTDSGIPDYRGPDGLWRNRRPMLLSDFMRGEESRSYYWARAYRGWERFRAASPNQAHRALARLEEAGAVERIVTQNVDGLHQAAGARNVLELHGTNHRVVCLDCRATLSRAEMQRRMAEANPGWNEIPTAFRADGDAEIDRELTRGFRVPPCGSCGGILKPDVVFFGENVPRERVEAAMASVLASDVLLVVGSSLAVWSGYRFARAAAAAGIPLAIVNLGWTRADDLASIKLEINCGEALTELAAFLA